MRINTKALRAGYTPKNGETHTMPIYQSTTYEYTSSDHIGYLFDSPTNGHIYSRITNPTCGFVEDKIAALEGGVGALLTTSGQMASLMAVLNLCKAGDHIVASKTLYGGTFNLFDVTLKRFGIQCSFVDQDEKDSVIEAAIQQNTRLLFGETLANPALRVLDIQRFSDISHRHNLPLIIDNTFPTPMLCRPFEHGADIIIHSTTKYMEGHAVQIGGCIVDGGTFDWTNGKFPEFTTPDESYHGIEYAKEYGKLAYIVKARLQLQRDFGALPSAQDAFLLDLGLQTLPLRMERHCQNAQRVAEFLEKHPKVEFVNYPGLKSSKYYALAKKYLPDGCAGVISFSIKGSRKDAARFIDALTLTSNAVHVADIRTLALHPASSTHRQMSDEQIAAAGITPGLIRLSIGCEDVRDILEDIEQALAKA